MRHPLIRRLLGISPVITVAEAMEIAEAEAAQRRWRWIPPVAIRESMRAVRFRTSASCRGENVSILVRLTDGRVMSAGQAQR